jgi:Fe-S cluster biogenesis protein NfuA
VFAIEQSGPQESEWPAGREQPEELLGRVQELQARLESAGDPQTRELAEELVSAVVRMYGEGLERLVGTLLGAGAEGEQLALALAEDPHVATLLLIHDLHPVPLQDRVQAALERVRPYMESHGGNVELLSLREGVARIGLRGSCSSCAASAVTLEHAVKQALEETAPDLVGLEVEDGATPAGPELPSAGPVLPMASGAPSEPNGGPHEPVVLGLELPKASGAPSESNGYPHEPVVRGLELPIAMSTAPAPSPAPAATSRLVTLPTGVAGVERCDLCGTTVPEDHRHLLNLVERRIECACESCWALRSGDAEYRPTGGRTLWLADLQLPEELWASFQIPIGLAFFMRSSTAGCVVAMYPSPGGATESELHFSSWTRMVELNPSLAGLEPDVEGLVVNRLSDPAAYVIAPIDRCYALTGTIKAHWEGLSGGPGVREAVCAFFEELRAEALPA